MKRVILLFLSCVLPLNAAEEFPPGWLPVEQLDASEPAWSEYKSNRERVHLYLPSEDQPVRGVFLCFIFHSADPRELARLWNM